MCKRLLKFVGITLCLVSLAAMPAGCGSTASNSPTTDSQPQSSSGPGGEMQKADTDGITHKWIDVAYAELSAAQKMDIFLPEDGIGPFPAIIQIHGGAFKSGDKASGELTPVLEALKRGYAVIAVNYRLSNEAQFPAQINDIKAAIRFVRANAETYSVNPDKIAIWGGSAGGSLAALAGTSGGVKALQDDSLGNADQSDLVQAVVDWFGPINFSTMDAEFATLGVTPMGVTSSADSPESAYLGKIVGSQEAEALVRQASPATYISADDPAFFIQHGTNDKNIPITQSANFADILAGAVGASKVTYTVIEGAGHGGAEFNSPDNISRVLDFLDAYLK